MKYCVYCHTNKENGKKYIGVTSQKPENRWRKGNGYKNNAYFFRAISVCGWDSFYHDIIESDLTKEDAELLEIKLIKEYDTRNPNKGYNIESGGNLNKEISESTKSKISNALKGHPCSEQTREKISESQKGKESKQKGVKRTPEQIQRNRISHIGQKAWNKGRSWTSEEKAKMG